MAKAKRKREKNKDSKGRADDNSATREGNGAASPTRAERARERKQKKRSEADKLDEKKKKKPDSFRTLLIALAIAFAVRAVVFEPFEIDGPSMEPTLLNGDRVVVSKFAYGLFLPFTEEALFSWGTPDRNDVVVVLSPADGEDIIKRVIGLPGDEVEVRDWAVFVNGDEVAQLDRGECEREAQLERTTGCHVFEETLAETQHRISYTVNRAFRRETLGTAPLTRVPEEHVYILGDHRDQSNDSRSIGTIPISRIKGRAEFIYWSHGDPSLCLQPLFCNGDVAPLDYFGAVRGARLFDGVN